MSGECVSVCVCVCLCVCLCLCVSVCLCMVQLTNSKCSGVMDLRCVVW